MKRAMLVAAVLVGTILATTAVAHSYSIPWPFDRVSVAAIHAVINIDGTVSDRYQAVFVRDRVNPAACVMVLRDLLKDDYEITAVDGESCR